MINKKILPLLFTLLVGILISCSSSNKFIGQAKSSIKSQDFQSAIDAANQSIKMHPNDPLGYFYKGTALSSIADTMQPPSARADYYKKMNVAFDSANAVAQRTGNSPKEIGRIDRIKTISWTSELNRSINLVQNDSLKQAVSNPGKKAVAHANNAAIIEPDSIKSWNVLSTLSAMNKDYDKAAQAKEKYIKMSADTSLKAQDYVQLGSFYYQTKNKDKVLSTFEEAAKKFPDNKQVTTRLAQAYTQYGKSDQAINMTKKLVDQNPQNARFRLSYGTQLLQSALNLRDKDKPANEDKIEDLTNKSEQQLKKVIDLDPQQTSIKSKAYNSLGIIYQNRARDTYDKRNDTDDNQEAARLDNQADNTLRKSMKYYEHAAQLDPDNKQYWNSLYSIYTTLGMDKKAEQARKKAGI